MTEAKCEEILVIGDFPDNHPEQGLRDLAAIRPGADWEYISLGTQGPDFYRDLFFGGYLATMQRARQYIAQKLADSPPGRRFAIIGRGLGGLVALWAAADNRTAPIQCVVSISSTPNLDYLKDKHPHYGWPADEVKKALLDWDVSYKVPRIGSRAVLLIHSDNDSEIRANWAEEFFLLATGVSKWPERWDYHRIPGLPHVWPGSLGEPCREALSYTKQWVDQYLDDTAVVPSR